MSHRLVLDGGDQEGREQDVRHLPVEEVHPVVRLGHHGGLVPAGGVVLHALQMEKKKNTLNVASGGKSEGFHLERFPGEQITDFTAGPTR